MTDTTRTRNTRSTRLERSREDRVIAGVAGGLGEHLGANPWLFRLAFIILAFFGGVGVLLYIVAWLLIPDFGEKEPIVAKWLGGLDTSDAGTIFGVVLVVAAILIVLAQVADVSGTLIVALVLFVFGFLLYRGDLSVKKRGDEPPPEGGDMDTDHSPETSGSDTADLGGSTVAATLAPKGTDDDPPTFEPPPPEPEVMWEPPPPRESSMLGRITIALGLIVLAAMALVDLAFERVDIAPVHYLGAAVAVLGLGLILGGWIGRARWLIIIGVVLLPALWFTSFWPQDFSFSAGEVRVAPDSAADVESPYQLGFGQLSIDLSDLTADELASLGTIKASVGMGELIVRLPADTGAIVNAKVGAGTVEGVANQPSGVGIDVTRVVPPSPSVVELDLEVGLGVITIDGPRGSFGFDADDGTTIIIEGSTR